MTGTTTTPADPVSFTDKLIVKVLGSGNMLDGQQKIFVTAIAVLAIWYVTDKIYGNKFTTPRAQFWSVFAILSLMVFAIITAQTGGIDPATGGTRGIPYLTKGKTYYPYVLNKDIATASDTTSETGLHDTQIHMYHFILSAVLGIGISFAAKEMYFSAKRNMNAVANSVNR